MSFWAQNVLYYLFCSDDCFKKMLTKTRIIIGLELAIALFILLGNPFPFPLLALVFMAIISWLVTRKKINEIGLNFRSGFLRTVSIAFLISIAYVLLEELVSKQLLEFFNLKVDLESFDKLEGDLPNTLLTIGFSWIVISTLEEVVYRTYLIGRFEDLFGSGIWSTILAIIIPAVVFGMGHLYQGVGGVIQETFYAILIGVIFVRSKKHFWMVYLIHGFANTWFLLLEYFGISF